MKKISQNLYLTRHVRRRMKWRNIPLKDIKKTLAHPDKVEHMSHERINAFKSMGKKLIRVTYLREESRSVVISVVDKNK